MKKIVTISITTTIILFGATVDTMNIDSTNTINNGTSIEGYSDVTQGMTDIQDSTVKNLKTESVDTINDIEIYGSFVEQATLSIFDVER